MKLIILNFLNLFKNSVKEDNYNWKTYLSFTLASSARKEKHKNKQTDHINTNPQCTFTCRGTRIWTTKRNEAGNA